SIIGFWVVMFFLIILTLGFFYEYLIGALKFHQPPSRQTNIWSNNSPPLISNNQKRLFHTSSIRERSPRDIGNIKYTSAYKNNISVSPFLDQVLIGLILGDMHIRKPYSTRSKGVSFYFRHSIAQLPYMEHIHSLFYDYTVQPINKSSSFDKRTKKHYFYCDFATLTFPCFLHYYELFYNKEGVKVIPSNIEELLTPVSLAYWIMDDGYLHKDKGLYLCTNFFTLEEVLKLASVLRSKFGLRATHHKAGIVDQYSIYISAKDLTKIQALVSDYIHDCMRYKINLS